MPTMTSPRPDVRPNPRPGVADVDPVQIVIMRLEEAGATLLALPQSGYTTALRVTRLDIINRETEPTLDARPQLRPATPTSGAVTRMDEAFAWLQLIPDDRHVLRRIVGARSLVHPLTGRHLHSWRRIGALLGADHRAIQRWHAEAINLIVRHLAGGKRPVMSAV